MKKLLLPFLCLSVLIACKSEGDLGNTGDSQEIADLKNEIEQLKLDKALKDSVIEESLAFFNEIQSNLESIGLKKDEIRLRTEDPELASDEKQWILEEIRHINYLREENARKVQQLSRQLKDSGLKLKELEAMIERLVTDIKARDEQIMALQAEMENMDQEYAKLFDAYQEVSFQVDYLTDQMNLAYYTYGSTKELESNGVIEQKNGFIGIGKRTKLKENFNENYFAKIDRTKDKEIFVEGSTVRMITDHPSSSYSIVSEGKNSRIVISNPGEFWKISNYLVVVVDN